MGPRVEREDVPSNEAEGIVVAQNPAADTEQGRGSTVVLASSAKANELEHYLDLLGVRYTGGGPGELYLRQDKGLAKKALAFDNIL